MLPALRMRSLSLWIAASVAVCPSVAAQQDDPWSECVVEDLGGTARRVRCSGMSVSLSRSPTMSQDGWLESLAADTADGATITREQLDVDGRPTLLRIAEALSVRGTAALADDAEDRDGRTEDEASAEPHAPCDDAGTSSGVTCGNRVRRTLA